ncbi:MAG: putative transposase [Patescibacteria group bacterium]
MEESNLLEKQNFEAFALIQLIEDKDEKKILVRGNPYMSWKINDQIAQRVAIVELYKSGLANQEQLSNIFKLHINSIYNYITTFETEGMKGLLGGQTGPVCSWKITPNVRSKILFTVLKERILKYGEIQKRLEDRWKIKVSIESIRQVLKENGFVKEGIDFIELEQEELFETDKQLQLEINFLENKNNEEKISTRVNEQTEEKKSDMDINNGEKKVIDISYYSSAQRIYLDELERGEYNVYAAGLLFIPLLQEYKFTSIIKRIINIETHEGYNLDEICKTLFYFDLFGFKSMENFKTVYVEEFGKLIGKLKSPGIDTLRSFLYKTSELNFGEKLIEEFAKEYIKSDLAKWGVLYIDGHFLPYYGMYRIFKGWHGVCKIPMKGSSNFIGVDEKFTPWIFLVRSSSEDLLQKIPEIIEKAKNIGREAGISEEQIENLIVIFDREGYSAELYRNLEGSWNKGEKRKAIFISWAKYSDKWVDEICEEKFDRSVTINYEIQKSKEIKYFETERSMNKYGKIRTIVIQSGAEKKRFAIDTNGSEKEIKVEIIVQLMCKRWGEENLIKELLYKHMIDYNPGYEILELEEQPMIDNPEIAKLKKERGNLISKINLIKIKIADNLLATEEGKKSKEKREKEETEIKAEIAILNHQVLKINEKIEKLPKEVRYDKAHNGKKLVKLNYERKRFLDCIKIFVFNMEKKMCKYLSNYYDKKKEIWPALMMIVRRGAYIKLEGKKLKIILRRFKNQEIDYAARHLCEELNQMKPYTLDRFHLPIHYEVV